MNVKPKSFSIFVILALLLSIGTMGGCMGFRQARWSEIITRLEILTEPETLAGHYYTAIRRTDASGDSKDVWVIKPQSARTRNWSHKGTPNLVWLSPESFEGNLTVTFGAPEDNKVIVTAKATATRTWRGRLLPWREYSETAWRTRTSEFTCNSVTGRWDETSDSTPDDVKHLYARVNIVHGVRKTKETSTLVVEFGGKSGYGSW